MQNVKYFVRGLNKGIKKGMLKSKDTNLITNRSLLKENGKRKRLIVKYTEYAKRTNFSKSFEKK